MIIGVTGPICSGTTTFMNILKDKGFHSFSYSDILREELNKRGIKIKRKNLQDIGNKLREKEGNGILSVKMINKMQNGKNYVIGNIRNPGEIEEFRKKRDFILVKINAQFDLRFERAKKRNRENDPLNLKDFKSIEEKDFGVNEEEYGQQHSKCFELADYFLENSGSLGSFKEKVGEFLETLNVK